MEDKYILINGAGTVGIRDADVLLSLDIPLILTKYNASEEDIKTKEMKALLDRYPNSNIKIYAGRGSNLEERISNFKEIIGKCNGSVDDIEFDKVSLAIECTDGKEGRVYNEIYKPKKIPFALNGGGDSKLVKSLYFASVPNCRVQENIEEYKKNNGKIVSCNTHSLTTAIGLLEEVLGKGEKFSEKLRDQIIIDFSRRYDDPGKKDKEVPKFVKIEHRPYHVDEVEFLHPEIKNLIDTTYSKWPTQYFHNLTITLDLKDEISQNMLEDIRFQVQTYPRTILVEDVLCHERTMKSAEKARIKDADIPFPVFMVDGIGKHHLRMYALTPQRGIVAPSTVDYVLLRTNFIKGINSWKDAFDFTNKNAKYRNETFGHIKESIQDNLSHYEEQVEK
jgi:glyceraldehyde-3-phosphate dehydrogenase/erythrose-4-phosphate dehydrogenase